MNKIDCRTVRHEIEEAASGTLFSAPAREHLGNCASCATFSNEQQKLKNMVASLGTIEAPSDFDFKLRARLAAAGSARRDLLRGNGFGVRSIAFATLVLLFGFAVILINVRSRTGESAPATQANGPASQTKIQTAQVDKNEQEETPAQRLEDAGTSSTNELNPSTVQRGRPDRLTKRRVGSLSQYTVARNGRVKATDLSATPAAVLRPTETATGSSVFPLGTYYQSLKVSVDDGRGSSRTISLPSVSFGSSQVLARNPAPVTAPMRDSW
jgi:hypothetical protein